jgi:hypothetical protein
MIVPPAAVVGESDRNRPDGHVERDNLRPAADSVDNKAWMNVNRAVCPGLT